MAAYRTEGGVLNLSRAREIAAEIQSAHPSVMADTLYLYGHGGYCVLVGSPANGQDDVVLVSERAYEVFRQFRSSSWPRRATGKDTSAEGRDRDSKLAILRLRRYQQEHHDEEDPR